MVSVVRSPTLCQKKAQPIQAANTAERERERESPRPTDRIPTASLLRLPLHLGGEQRILLSRPAETLINPPPPPTLVASPWGRVETVAGSHGRDAEAAGRPHGGQSQRRRGGGQPELLRPRRLPPLPCRTMPARPLPAHGTLFSVLTPPRCCVRG
jgi:hypothetical protein